MRSILVESETSKPVEAGMVYLVPTPIGNLGDISERALEVLRSVDMVACEDTRNSGRLLKHYDISQRLISYHEFNESSRAEQLIEAVHQGKDLAVVTDGGAPGISDPAYRIVRAAIDAGIEVSALPGPCAIIPALTASGLPTDRFFYEGFLSPKSAARNKRLGELAELPHTLVFYESPHRVAKAVTAMAEILGDRPACLAREISKKFEEFRRGSLTEIAQSIETRAPKGEIVLIVAGKPKEKKSKRGDDD